MKSSGKSRNGFEQIPAHDEYFDEGAYLTALHDGYSDEEAYRMCSARTDSRDTLTDTQYRYPDPNQLSMRTEQDGIIHNKVAQLHDASRYYDGSRFAQVTSAGEGVGASGIETRDCTVAIGGQRLAFQDYKQHIDLGSPSTAEVVTSPMTSSTSSAQVTLGTSVSPSTPLPDTYAGRRSAQGRSNFPRECGACGRRFLYEDSALKHYRKHHGEPPHIILRYDAPKRPPPGLPRNIKAARARVRQSATPPASVPITTATPSRDQINRLESSESPIASADQVGQLSSSNLSCSTYNHSVTDSDETNDTVVSTSNLEIEDSMESTLSQRPTPQLLIHTETGRAYVDDFGQYDGHNGSAASPTNYDNPWFPQYDARYAAMQVRQELSQASSHTAQEEVARTNPHLVQRQLGQPTNQTARETQNTDMNDEDLPNIKFLKHEAGIGNHPPLPPAWAYDNTDASLTFHPDFGSYYRRDQSGQWRRWCEDTGRWD